LRNDASESRLLQGLLVDPVSNQCFDPTGGCVPLNLFGEGNLSAEGVEFIRYADFTNLTERTHKLASVFVTGSPIDTWAGPLDLAVGAEWRSDDTYFKADDALFTGDALGWGGKSTISGTEEVFEIYTEAVIPLLSDRAWADYVGLEVGGRIKPVENGNHLKVCDCGLCTSAAPGRQIAVNSSKNSVPVARGLSGASQARIPVPPRPTR
jgi:hypothetical protein